MKKLQKARTALSVAVAGFTGSAIALVSDQITAAFRLTSEIAKLSADANLGKALLLFSILVPALYVTHILFKWLASWAFNVEWVRKLLLGQDYVEGYWLVDNRIDDHVVSTGFMHYQIVDEQLKIEGAHFSPFDDQKKSKKTGDTRSIAADCFDGEYYNHFEIPGVGRGVASGKFSSKGRGGSIPDSFQVQVIVATPPDRIFEWGQNAPDWVYGREDKGFSYLPDEKRNELISSMAHGKVVTMHQHGVRISKYEFDTAKKENPKNYQRILSEKHYKELQADAS